MALVCIKPKPHSNSNQKTASTSFFIKFEHECTASTIGNPSSGIAGLEAPYYEAFTAAFDLPAFDATSQQIVLPTSTVSLCGDFTLAFETDPS